MSGNITNTHENALLDYSLADDAVYLALLSTAGSDSAAGTELSGNGYSRGQMSMAAASGGSKANDAPIVFGPVSGSDWLTIVGFAIYDAPTGGNRLWHFTLAGGDQRQPKVGDTYTVDTGDLTFTLD